VAEYSAPTPSSGVRRFSGGELVDGLFQGGVIGDNPAHGPAGKSVYRSVGAPAISSPVQDRPLQAPGIA
jgi:hypothetical protein